MDWEKVLLLKLKNEDYKSALSILKNNILNSIDEKESSICLIYVYLYIIVESNISNHYDFINPLKLCFKKMYRQFNLDSSFLFYTAYMASRFGEFYLGIKEFEVMHMFCKALEIDSNNLLYQWGYDLYVKNLTLAQRKKYALYILQSEPCINELNKQPLLGESILQHLHFEAFGMN